jgi:hypothetical protein
MAVSSCLVLNQCTYPVVASSTSAWVFQVFPRVDQLGLVWANRRLHQGVI